MSSTVADRAPAEAHDNNVVNHGVRTDEHRHQDLPGGGEPLWTAADVASFLRASRSWVYQRAASGRLPCLKIGGLLRFSPEAVRAYALDAGKVAR